MHTRESVLNIPLNTHYAIPDKAAVTKTMMLDFYRSFVTKAIVENTELTKEEVQRFLGMIQSEPKNINWVLQTVMPRPVGMYLGQYLLPNNYIMRDSQFVLMHDISRLLDKIFTYTPKLKKRELIVNGFINAERRYSGERSQIGL